ncbi:MAG: HDOD domain-containing protein [Candidatus Krumholzibacteriia bacterium]
MTRRPDVPCPAPGSGDGGGDGCAAGVLDRLCRVEDLPSIPETLIRILRVLEDPVSSAQALADAIQCDAPLTTKILRLASSPLYPHGGEPPRDIRSCVRVLGFRTVRQVAICVSIASSLVTACSRRRSRLDYRELWMHSVLVASYSRELARLRGDGALEDLFTAGLLHDLGKFLLVIQVPGEYDAVIRLRHESGRPLVEVERQLLGTDHASAGAAYMRHWCFPDALVACCGTHHDGRRMDRQTALVALADHLVNTGSPPASDLGFDARHAAAEALCAAAGLTPDRVDEAQEALATARADAEALVEIS